MTRLTLILSTLFAILSFTAASTGSPAPTHGYDEEMSKALAHASLASYCGESALKSWTCGDNCKNLQGYELIDYLQKELLLKHSASYSAFINHDSKRIIVAYRGTNTAIQLFKESFYSQSVPCKICSDKDAEAAHYFYYFYMHAFRERFISSMMEYSKKYADYDFYVTGHSLGGAFATLAALDLSDEVGFPTEKIYLYTFGSPRVGNKAFAHEVASKVKQSWRVVHSHDIVPHVPPKKALLGILFFGWHVNTEVYYNKDFSSYQICKQEEDSLCSNSLSLPTLRVEDHLIYMNATNACVDAIDFVLPGLADIKTMFKPESSHDEL